MNRHRHTPSWHRYKLPMCTTPGRCSNLVVYVLSNCWPFDLVAFVARQFMPGGKNFLCDAGR